MEVLQQLKSWHVEGRTLVLDGGWEGSVRLTPALPGVVQVVFRRGTPWSKEEIYNSLTVDPKRWPNLAAPVVDEREEHLLVQMAGVTVRVDRQPIRLSYWAASVQVMEGAAGAASGGEAFLALSGGGTAPATGEVSGSTPATVAEPEGEPLLAEATEGGLWKAGWTVGARFRLHPGDRFFGVGTPDQQAGPIPFNHTGRRYPLHHSHIPAPSRMVCPVVISRRGYGLFIDNPWIAEWDLGAGGESFGYTAQGGQMIYYFIAGPALTDVLDRLTALTGRPALAPKWALGLLQSKYGYRNRQEVEALVTTFRQKGIPLDSVILDLFWFRKMGDLAFDRSAFPDPAGLIAWLREQGVRLIVIEEPYVARESRLFAEGERLGLFGKRPDGTTYTFPFWSGECALVDFTQPLARQWWADQHKPLIEMGMGGWWTDLNEPEDHPQDMIHQGGAAPAVHNVYNFYMLKALKLAQEQQNPHGRLFILSRSGWPGTQALGAGQWSGDVATTWSALANQIPIGLSVSLMGMVYWNTDIGGFNGPPTGPELYIRWMQFGTFTPLMRPHGANAPREPWAFGPEAEAIVTRFIRLRYQLLPYTYTLAHEAYRSGLPLMRPLVLHYPDDDRTVDLRDQYLWGRDVLVAPVVAEGANQRRVYLAEGVWYDYWTNRQIRGGRYITAAAPLETIPLYVRAGAILPLAPERPSTGGAWDALTLAIYPGEGPSSFTLYEDDGETTAYEHGVTTATEFRFAGNQVYIGEQGTRAYSLQVRLARRPAGVTLGDGGDLAAKRSRESLGKAGTGWWYDQKAKVLHVKLGTVSGPATVTIR
ncbi:MAG TPA: glycoside hydrolase family 31 protein [Symbiobacteriaceae bacterium]|nr:glycoside hydrolase family 31 protein [Symbiobacteriaceae bacterium]